MKDEEKSVNYNSIVGWRICSVADAVDAWDELVSPPIYADLAWLFYADCGMEVNTILSFIAGLFCTLAVINYVNVIEYDCLGERVAAYDFAFDYFKVVEDNKRLYDAKR